MFKDCLKNGFKCETVYKPRYDKVSLIKKDIITTTNETIILNDKRKLLQSQVDSKKKDLELYTKYHVMYNDLAPIEQIGKPISIPEIKAIMKSSLGMECVDNKQAYPVADRLKYIDAVFVPDSVYYRIPLNLIKLLVGRSAVNKFRYSGAAGGFQHPDGTYACNDFAASLYYEFKLAPLGYHKTLIGILAIANPGHRINLVIPSDSDDVYWLEPQQDQIWHPSDEELKTRCSSISQIIF